ncbi:HXXEE domain-containing protein [Levilactobacillus bambusae]|uniref:HXXEE domain-containing protein n=1 Tax=Levilactobacillus bambusae TaxID=2024736 RepID=A0A2V1N0B2_9LACO|nr:HXXEE domain-containing protein [Levilactobacillus bambusae]PWG00502.1 hypothetical protein DCM90_06145 [Levilactobacillus bambusae]
MTIWLWFVRWGWLYCMLAMSILLSVQLILNWRSWNTLTKLGAFTVIVLTLHVWEEWVIPGGFHVIYNLHSQFPDRYPMSELTDMLTNFLGGLLWFSLTETKHFDPRMGVATALFSFFEFIIHNFLALQSLAAFGRVGQNVYYAPGLITATLCWLPLDIGFVVYFNQHQPSLKIFSQGVLILLLMTFFIVQLPEKVLKNPINPYAFDNQGWYQQFKK